MTEFKSEHNLDFEVAKWELSPEFHRFRVGTCTGLYRASPESYDILGIKNSTPGNGHFNDVLQWFENSCKRDNRKLRVLEVWNDRLKEHLVSKRGFKLMAGDNVEK